MKVYLPEGAGLCVKRPVTAVLVMPNGNRYASSNFCMKPQTVCPRETAGYAAGEGYHLCKEVCDQPAHAEVNVVKWARFNEGSAAGGAIYVDHTWVCDNCSGYAKTHACTVHIGPPPSEHAQRQWDKYEMSRRVVLGESK